MINAHNTTVNAVLIERCKVSVVLISTSSASVLFFFMLLLCSRILSYRTIVSLIEYPMIVSVTATNASLTGILKIPKIKSNDQNIMNKRDHSCDSGCKTSQCRKRSRIYTTMKRNERTIAIAEFFNAFAPIYGSTADVSEVSN